MSSYTGPAAVLFPGISAPRPRYLRRREANFTSSTGNQETPMGNRIARRDFLKLAGLGSVGVVLASALPGVVQAHGDDDFFFLQLSDTHWGFEGAPNPDARGTLPKTIRAINN